MSLLLQVIREPKTFASLTLTQWSLLMQEIRGQRISARVAYLLEDNGLVDVCPESVWQELEAQRHYPRFVQAQMRLELRKVCKALAHIASPIMLLKGVAYQFAELPLARGRVFADLDILVPRGELAEVESALCDRGWETAKLSRYDQRYYRRWMHEIPPLAHPERGIEVDVHHSILPMTSRLKPDPALIWQDSVPLEQRRLRVPSPRDMVIHSAAHTFQDGEIRGALRDLLDIHEMLCAFGRLSGFWDGLLARADQLQLGTPLYYALSATRSLLGTEIPAGALKDAEAFAPNRVTRALMLTLMTQALEPRYPTQRPAHLAAWLLYLRSHWLRMPPGLLAAHLLRKALRGSGH
jgi:hypothetical protein